MANIRTRFAPSPTGEIHIGNFRTALFAYLFARHNNGTFILRVEDTDQNRKVEGAMENMIAVLEKMGLQIDEGPGKGEHGPYIQSERLDIYKKYIDELIAKGGAYYCFCSAERLEELRAEQTALKQPPMYDRHCRNLSDEELATKQAEFKAAGKNPVVRQANPSDGQTIVHDIVYGDITYDNATLDDQVLIKSDGFPTYHFAVVIDDHLMEVSHIIRGEEWMPSTPKHIILFNHFGWDIPKFAHFPLILNPDKSKLSKRQGDVSVEDFLSSGYLEKTLVNFVALLGWNPKTEQEIFSLQELIEQFDLAKGNKSGAVFDRVKLDWMNSHYIREMSDEELLGKCLPFLEQQSINLETFDKNYLLAVVNLEKERLKKLSEIGDEHAKFYFGAPNYDGQILVWKKSDAATTKQNLKLLQDLFNISGDDVLGDSAKLEETIKAFIAEHGLDNGSVLWPLRVAMTGLEKSPGPFQVTATLFKGWGRAGLNERLEKAISLL